MSEHEPERAPDETVPDPVTTEAGTDTRPAGPEPDAG